MADKKADAAASTPEDEVLQKRVEMIMGERNADGVTPAVRKQMADSQPEIDIFKDPKTAPAVSAQLLKQIGAEPAPVNEKPPAVETPAAPEESQPASIPPDSADIEDDATDKAVDEIARNESDTVLAAEDAAADEAGSAKPVKIKKQSGKFGKILKNKWLWIGLVVVIVATLAIPYTRYKVLGLVWKESVTITVTDSTTKTPVSTALVSINGTTVKTEASGKAVVKVGVGQRSLTVTKQYYTQYSGSYFVTLSSGQTTSVKLVATGRQVPVLVVNKISGKPLADAQISVLDTTAKTDAKGKAIIVLPTKTATNTATISLTGYNTAQATITVTDQAMPSNTFSLVPAGKIYFLSNLSGKIDVVKANLDGSGRQTVLAGTGKEDPNSTSLLAARDWRYLVLKAQRDTPQPALYLIDTSNDKITNFDNGDADFTLIGWYGHNFMYDVSRNSVSSWTAGHEAIKSYAADSGQLNLLDQNQAEGTSTSYAYQGFYNFYIINGLLTYNTQWYTYNAGGGGYDLTGKNDSVRAIQPNGQGKKDYQSYAASGVGYTQAALYEPAGVYYAVYNYNSNQTTYYKFENQTVSTVTNLTQASFNQPYPTYLLSPSGSQTFWTELRDGKNSLFVGDSNAASPKQIATLSDYSPYGWYTDNYVLVSKSSSELYILPATGQIGSQVPLKITDYYKPTQSFQGYGYGYGGL